MGDQTPFEFFRQELSNIDPIVRTEAMSKVTLIAALIGPDKTRNDLLPFLQTKLGDLDQVLLMLANKLEKLFHFLGGPEYSHALIPLFETLSEIEEVTVRNAAMTSASKILRHLNPTYKLPIQTYFEMFKRISNEETGEAFYSRVSACHLVPDLYAILAEPERGILQEIFTRLCKDELPIVRRAACSYFLTLSKLLDNETLTTEFSALHKGMTADENLTIQVYAIEQLSQYAQLLKKINATNALSFEILPLIKTFAEDPSWKIRLSISKKFGLFAECFSTSEVTTDVFPNLMTLIQDVEPDVRTTSMNEVLSFIGIVPSNVFLEEFNPVAQHLSDDPVSNVRKLLAEICIDVAARLSHDVVTTNINELVIKFVDDEDPLVRLRVIKKIPIMAECVPILCTRLTEYFKALFGHSNWRVRKELAIAMPSIVKYLEAEFFMEHFLLFFLLLLKDGVDQVRVACASAIPMIAHQTNNIKMVHDKLFPSVKAMQSDDYLVRLTMLTAVQGFLEIPDLPDSFIQEVIPLLLHSITDKVPNIRLRAAQVVNYVSGLPHLEQYKAQMRSTLNELQSDKDNDVKYFATSTGVRLV